MNIFDDQTNIYSITPTSLKTNIYTACINIVNVTTHLIKVKVLRGEDFINPLRYYIGLFRSLFWG